LAGQARPNEQSVQQQHGDIRGVAEVVGGVRGAG
jgi:hypothetical protein